MPVLGDHCGCSMPVLVAFGVPFEPSNTILPRIDAYRC